MKKPITLFFLIICSTCFSQNSDSLKSILKKLSLKKTNIERDSNVTVTLYNLFVNTSIADLKQQKFWVDSLNNFSKVSIWNQSKFKGCLAEGRYLQRIGHYSDAFEILEEAINFYKNTGNDKDYANAINIMSTTIVNDIFDSSFQSQNVNNENKNKYLTYLLSNIKIAEKSKDLLLMANQQTGLGLYYFSLKNYKNSYHHYKKAYSIVKNEPKKYWYQYYGGIWAQGLNLLYLNKKNEGFKLINIAKKACEIKTEGGYEHFLKSVIGLFLGNYYLDLGNPLMAITELNYGLKSKNIIKNSAFDRHYSQAFYKAYKVTNNYKMALVHYEELFDIVSKKDYQKFKGQYVEYLQKYEDEKQKMIIKSLENERLQKENEKNNLVRNILISSLMAGIGLIVYVFANNKKLQSKNKELQTKNEEIEHALLKGQTLERKRVAEELHDNLSAKISGIRMRMEAIKPIFNTDKEEKIYQSSVNAMAEVYTDVRLISHNLLPAELETKGLALATQNLVNELNTAGKTEFVFENLINEKRFSSKIEYELFSIILELSNNIMKHSKAKNAEIKALELPGYLQITVTDNGIGVDIDYIKKGMGFANLYSRVDSLKGNINFENNNGLKIDIKVPI